MTWTKKQQLPALHKSDKVKGSDLAEIGDKNYTSTILKYAGLAVKFAQLETQAKTIVPAINEVRVIPNPPLPISESLDLISQGDYLIVTEGDDILNTGGDDAPELKTVLINGTIYRVSGDGYVLPIATSDTLGGIKVGSGLRINPVTGVLSSSDSLSNLRDVDLEDVADGQIIVYDSETERWVNRDGGGDYSAGYGIYFTGENGSVINADAGRISNLYSYLDFDRDWAQSGQYHSPCWDDIGTTPEGQTIYESKGGTYDMPSGNSTGTYIVEGYDDVTIYVKQDNEDTENAFMVIGDGYNPIDLDNHRYTISYQGETLADYVPYHFENLYGGHREYQVMYHVNPSPSGCTVTLDLNNGQWTDSGQIIDDHTVYMSDQGSYHINNGKSTCTIHLEGVTSFTLHCKASSENGYDWLYVSALDQTASSSGYLERYSGNYGWDIIRYNCTEDPHTIQLVYQKDSSVNSNDDRGYFYYEAVGQTNKHRGYVYLVPGQVHDTTRGEVFNDYSSNYATGMYSHSEGSGNRAFGYSSHTEGGYNITRGSYAHAEGNDTQALGSCTHTEGFNTRATAEDSHAEGLGSQALGAFAHAEGYETIASGDTSHAENRSTIASGENSHAEGRETRATAYRAHAEGGFTLASGNAAHAEGYKTVASGENGHAEGYYSEASGFNSHAEGYCAVANYTEAHAEGGNTLSSGHASHAEGRYSQATASGAHAEGCSDSNSSNPTTASGVGAHAEGCSTRATANFAHSEGLLNTASGMGSHAEGYGGFTGANNASGIGAHAEGGGNIVSGNCAHGEGTRNNAIGEAVHVEGSGNYGYGRESHVEGSGNSTWDQSGHTEGAGNTNLSQSGHVEGAGNTNITQSRISHTEGAGNTNYGHQAHIEGSGNTLSGEESHLEGAGNQVHGPKNHGEGGGNIAYAFGSHIEGKHNVAAGFGQHIEGIDNYIGVSTAPGSFSYGTNYAIGDIVGINNAYLPNYDFPEDQNSYIFRCVTAPGQIQAGNGVTFITPTDWNSSTAYSAGSVVRYNYRTYYYTNYDISAGTIPTDGGGWNKIYNILSPFTTKTFTYAEYFLLSANAEIGSTQVIARVEADTTVNAMWEKVSTSQGAHVEGKGNISIGDFQHVGGKYNSADATKSFIIGNGTADNARSNALTLDWSGNMTTAGDITTGVALSTTAQTLGAAINEIVASGGSSASPIPDSFIYSLFS